MSDSIPAQNETSASETKAVKCSVSLPHWMKETAEELAKADGRSLSNYIQSLIKQDADRKKEPEGAESKREEARA